jgi:hypothetical protein
MTIDNLTIGEAKQLAALFGATKPNATTEYGTQIVVLDRGFVYVGEVRIEGDFCIIEDAQNIRIWGTTKGLGELREGPTSKTVTDPAGTVRAPMRAVIALIEVGGKWKR